MDFILFFKCNSEFIDLYLHVAICDEVSFGTVDEDLLNPLHVLRVHCDVFRSKRVA
jgi:hypothetical protein